MFYFHFCFFFFLCKYFMCVKFYMVNYIIIRNNSSMEKNQNVDREQYSVPCVEIIPLELGMGVCQAGSPGEPLNPEDYEFN